MIKHRGILRGSRSMPNTQIEVRVRLERAMNVESLRILAII
jgi:hypothetical protein